jgi:hypothetical protein
MSWPNGQSRCFASNDLSKEDTVGQPINVNIGELRGLLSAIGNAETAMVDTRKRLRAALARANWTDPAGRAFGERLEEALRHLDQFENASRQSLAPTLRSKISQLETYLSH